MRPDAGRLVTRNPFAGLRIKQSRGRRDVQPPAQKDAAGLVALADELTPPSFAAYLHTDVYEGVRPVSLTRCDGTTSTSRPAPRRSSLSGSGTHGCAS